MSQPSERLRGSAQASPGAGGIRRPPVQTLGARLRTPTEPEDSRPPARKWPSRCPRGSSAETVLRALFSGATRTAHPPRREFRGLPFRRRPRSTPSRALPRDGTTRASNGLGSYARVRASAPPSECKCGRGRTWPEGCGFLRPSSRANGPAPRRRKASRDRPAAQVQAPSSRQRRRRRSPQS